MQTDETRVEVIQADRVAAAALSPSWQTGVLDGLYDESALVQALARHRAAFAAPPAVELREMPVDDEIRPLREALAIYGDRVRMATSCRPDLQQVIDYSFEHTQDRPAFGGDSETRPTPLPSDREAIARVIDPEAWATAYRNRMCSNGPYTWHQALAKADAILALSGSVAPEGGEKLSGRLEINTILAKHFAPFIDDIAERIRVGNLACTEILAALPPFTEKGEAK